jgi:hypothetical protein
MPLALEKTMHKIMIGFIIEMKIHERVKKSVRAHFAILVGLNAFNDLSQYLHKRTSKKRDLLGRRSSNNVSG